MTYRRLGTEVSSRTDAEIDAVAWAQNLLTQTLGEMGQKWDVHLPAFLSAPSLARILWLNEVYRKAVDVPGCLVEFGSQWGASLNVFLLLKQIYEPWNAGRKILSFSTFDEGFTSISPEDDAAAAPGDYRVAAGWDESLRRLLASHSLKSPLGADENFDIIPGDARETFVNYVESHQELVISHAHFDMDIYAPTRDLLKLCLPRMPKGAVLIFDELNCHPFPGETLAVQEVLGISHLSLRKSPFQPYSAYAIVGE